MKLIGHIGRLLVASLALSALTVVSASAGSTDSAVRAALTSGKSVRVIMNFATTADRDGAFDRLLERGAAVAKAETEAGPMLIAFGSAGLLSSEFTSAAQVSLDASVHVLASQVPARATSARTRARQLRLLRCRARGHDSRGRTLSAAFA